MIVGIFLIALIAAFLLIISPVISLSFQKISNWMTEILGAEAVVIFLPTIVFVEHALKTKFDDRGHYKEKRAKSNKK